MGSSLASTVLRCLNFSFLFAACLMLMIAICTPYWVRDLDTADGLYFERVSSSDQSQAFPTLETHYESLGLWSVESFDSIHYSLPIRDAELVFSSSALVVAVVCGVFVYVIFSYQVIERENKNIDLGLMVVSLWCSLLCVFASGLGTSVTLSYFKDNFRFRRFGYSHNLAWTGFGLAFLAFIFAIILFAMDKKELEERYNRKFKPRSVYAGSRPTTPASTFRRSTTELNT